MAIWYVSKHELSKSTREREYSHYSVPNENEPVYGCVKCWACTCVFGSVLFYFVGIKILSWYVSLSMCVCVCVYEYIHHKFSPIVIMRHSMLRKQVLKNSQNVQKQTNIPAFNFLLTFLLLLILQHFFLYDVVVVGLAGFFFIVAAFNILSGLKAFNVWGFLWV